MADAFETAAAAGAGEPPIETVPGKRTRTRKPPQPVTPPAAAAAPADAQTPEGQGIGIPPEQIRMAMGPFLKSMATLTKTSPPMPEEVDGIATNLSYGLGKTKFGGGANSGPWAPLLISLSLYAIPRAIEAVMLAAERMEQRKQEKARAGSTFRSENPARPPAAVGPGESTDGAGPVSAVGARVDG